MGKGGEGRGGEGRKRRGEGKRVGRREKKDRDAQQFVTIVL